MAYRKHESAIVDEPSQIGDDTTIWHFCHVEAGARIGRACSFGQNCYIARGVVVGDRVKVQNNVSIYAGTVIEDDVFLGPSCVLTNVSNPRAQVTRRALYEPTLLKRGCSIGANATVVCGTLVGRYALIGAGAVVAADVPDYALMLGVPARRAAWVSRHGHRLPFGPDGTAACPESGLRYRLDETSGIVRCLDLDEEAPLPAGLATGRGSYESFKARRHCPR